MASLSIVKSFYEIIDFPLLNLRYLGELSIRKNFGWLKLSFSVLPITSVSQHDVGRFKRGNFMFIGFSAHTKTMIWGPSVNDKKTVELIVEYFSKGTDPSSILAQVDHAAATGVSDVS